MVVFLLFKLFADFFWFRVLNWEISQSLQIPNKWYFLISHRQVFQFPHILKYMNDLPRQLTFNDLHLLPSSQQLLSTFPIAFIILSLSPASPFPQMLNTLTYRCSIYLFSATAPRNMDRSSFVNRLVSIVFAASSTWAMVRRPTTALVTAG